jgi:hypothetical protein
MKYNQNLKKSQKSLEPTAHTPVLWPNHDPNLAVPTVIFLELCPKRITFFYKINYGIEESKRLSNS